MSSSNKRWANFPKHFDNINEKDAVNTDTYLSIISTYKEFNVNDIYVKHMYVNGKAKLTSFVIDSCGNLKTIFVWKDPGGSAMWDPSLVKLINKPKKKRKRKIKFIVAKKIERVLEKKSCKEHEKYAARRSPRTKCKTCWEFYYSLHPDKKK